MKRVRLLCVISCLSLLGVGFSAPIGITSVDAGINGSPPYDIVSITVGAYTVNADQLRPGTSQIITNFDAPSAPENADNLNLNSIVARHNADPDEWTISNLGGQSLYQDINGDAPDFFLFEAGMNDSFTIQAILPGSILGQSISVNSSTWTDAGLSIVGSLNSGQSIGGIAFSVSDLLDDTGTSLTGSTAIEGLLIVSSGMDPTSFSAVVPEPASMSLLAIGSILALRRRKKDQD